jgi:hypothetical protein
VLCNRASDGGTFLDVLPFLRFLKNISIYDISGYRLSGIAIPVIYSKCSSVEFSSN